MGLLEWAIIAGALVFVFVCVFILAAVMVTRAFRSKAKPARVQSSVVTYSAPASTADPNMFAALSGGGPEATAIVRDAHIRYGLKRNLREHYEATKHLLDDPTSATITVSAPAPTPAVPGLRPNG